MSSQQQKKKKSCFQFSGRGNRINSSTVHMKSLHLFTDLFTSQSLTRLMYIFLHLHL